MEPADLGNGDDPANWWGFDDSGLETVVVERLMWPCGVVVGEVGTEEPPQMALVENDDVVEALSSDQPMGHPGATDVERLPL
jgi:hypothetical protein